MKTNRLVFFTALSACAISGALYAAPLEKRLNVAPFSSVETKGAFDTVVTIGKPYSVVIRGDSSDLDQIEAKVDDGRLEIGWKSRLNFWSKSKGHILVLISTPSLNGFAISGSGDAKISGVKAHGFNVSIAGSGNAAVSGTCTNLTAQIAGSGDIRAENLKCQSVEAKIAGSGDISVFATDSAQSKIAGSGDIRIHGNPKSKASKIAGSGSVSYEDDLKKR